jgi:hypothetical protein
MRNVVTWSRLRGSHTSWGPISLPSFTAFGTSIFGRQNMVFGGRAGRGHDLDAPGLVGVVGHGALQ